MYDTKLGTEELTNDIPNEEATRDLDENGMIRIGAEVNRDILIGKITLRRIRPTPEENY